MIRRGRMGALLLLGLLGVRAAVASDDPARAALLDRSHDRILERADITSRAGRHGEVRIVERGRARVVQTLLHSKLLRRVVGEIRDREASGWPEGDENHAASARYVAALEQAERGIARPSASEWGAKGDRHRSMLIEFAQSDATEAVAILEPRVRETDGELIVDDVRLIEVLDLPRSFVRREMQRIVEEHFPDARESVLRLLVPPGDAEKTTEPEEDERGTSRRRGS